MKKFSAYILYTLLLSAIVCACSNDLDIHKVYSFDLVTMPIQKKIVQNETAEIRCQLVKEGEYNQVQFFIRYFQSDGKGELRMDDGTAFLPNDRYPLNKTTFNLYYTSLCTDQQVINVYIEDNFGQVVQKTFSWQNDNGEEEEEPINTNFNVETLPYQPSILVNDTVRIKCSIVKEDERNNNSYRIRYFQPSGKGVLLLNEDTSLTPNEFYELDNNDFELSYISNCEEKQTIDIYVIDNQGKVVQKTFHFENEYIEPEPEIDIHFEFTTLPIPKTISVGETVEIRCSIVKSDDRNNATYFIRYFQPDGKGELRMDDGTVFLPNDLYSLGKTDFKLYYTSNCFDPQTIDIYIEDSFGQVVQSSFSFQNESTEPEPEIDIHFEFTTLPVPKALAAGETIEIRCSIKKSDDRNNANYFIRYFQPDGKGELRMDNGTVFLPNDLYSLDRTDFRIYYTSHCTVPQTIDIYIEDSFGQVVQSSFSFQNESTDSGGTNDENEE